MHACLSVDEIVRLLACELVAAGGKLTAVALACCHKTLEDPVLDVLWGIQDRLYPLLETFPASVWDEAVKTFVSLPMTPQLAPPQPLDLHLWPLTWRTYEAPSFGTSRDPRI